MGKTFEDLVNEAKGLIREVTTESVKGKIDSEHQFVLVDVREDSEWEMGHLPTAIHLGRGILERDAAKVIPDSGAEIILYCGGGYRSALAAQVLQTMGYTDVSSLDGGYARWVESCNRVQE